MLLCKLQGPGTHGKQSLKNAQEASHIWLLLLASSILEAIHMRGFQTSHTAQFIEFLQDHSMPKWLLLFSRPRIIDPSVEMHSKGA